MYNHFTSITELLTLRPVRLGFIAHFLTALSLCWMPLFDILGFERAFVTGVIAGPIAGLIGIAAAQKRQDNPQAKLIVTLSQCVQVNLLFLIPSLLCGLTVEWLTQACNPQEGIILMAILPGTTIICGSSLGLICGRLFSSAGRAKIALTLVFVLALVSSLLRLYDEPQIFVFSMPFGYWPGSLYDEEVRVTKALMVHRGMTVLFAISLVLTVEGLMPSRHSLSSRFTLRMQSLLASICCAMGAYHFSSQGETLGFDLTRESLDKVLSRHVNNERFELRIDPSIPQDTLRNVVAEHEVHYKQLQDFFEEAPDRPIRVYIYRNLEQKRFLMGAHRTQIARPWAHEIHVHGFDVPHRVLKHELAHVFAAKFATGFFKVPASGLIFVNMGIVEGTAVAADWRADQMTVHEWARAMRAQGGAPDPRTILYPQGFWAISASKAYTIAGSFLRYLIDKYGIDRFKVLYKENDFEAAYRTSLDKLVTEWEQFIDKMPLNDRAKKKAEHRFTRPGIFKKVCAHESAKMASDGYQFIHAGDFAQGITLLEKVQENRPHSAYNYLYIANALAKDGQYGKARTFIKRAKDLSSISAQSRTLVALADADLEWRTGNSTVAARKYAAAEISHLPVGQRRLVSAKMKAIQQPRELESLLRSFFLQEYSRAEGLVRLSEQVQNRPQDGLLHYLYARQLEQIGMCQRGLSEIALASKQSLPTEDFYHEATQMKGRLLMCAEEYQAAQTYFQALVDSSTRAVDQLRAQEWKLRAQIRSKKLAISE